MVEVPQYTPQVRAARPDKTAIRAPSARGLITGLGVAGNELGEMETLHLEREATAQAKERDALVSDEIRKLMYDPEGGFMTLEGQNAVGARANLMSRLDELEKRATDKLSPAAARKVRDAIRSRVDRAKQSADIHTASARKTWLDAASASRMSAAMQDAILSGGDISRELSIARDEAMQAADGLGPEATQLAILEAQSKVVNAAISGAMETNPLLAMDILERNRENMTAKAALDAEAVLKPKITEFKGRQAAASELAAFGDMTAVFDMADDMIGMTETEATDALAAHFANSGMSLDPTKDAWCAAWINGTLAAAGLGGTNSNLARSFLKWGEGVDTPKRGDVVVLSRGSDPSKGHVGFFAGYDEAGRIMLLGGNQSDAVNVKAYDPSRVLGFRRAPTKGGDQASVAEAVQRLSAIEDPDVRQAALDEFGTRVAADIGVRDARLNEAMSDAFDLIESGVRVDTLPESERQALGMDRMNALRAAERSKLSGEDTVTDPVVFMELHGMLQTNPKEVSSVLLEYQDRLSITDLKWFATQATQPPSPTEGKSTATLMSIAKLHAKNTVGDEFMPALQSSLVRWQAQFIQENNRAPTHAEIEDRVRSEVVEVVINPEGIWNQRSGELIEIDFEGLSIDGLDENGTVTIDERSYSQAEMKQLAEGMSLQLNRDVTLEEVVRALARKHSRY